MSRYIDADAVCELFEPFTDAFTDVEVTSAYVQTLTLIHNTPSIDIVRCAECKYYEAKEDWCYWRDEAITADDFCSYGEREGE